MSVTGVEGEERNDYSTAESRQIRQRSLRLLGSLIRPVRPMVILTLVVVIVSTAAQVAGPAFIAYGIDTGLPAALNRDWMPLWLTVIAYLVTGIIGAVLIAWYTVLTARVSQAILIDLRKRVFLHTQRLSLDFHESYTSGRIIARQTSDLDAIRELLDSGINQLVQGALYMLFIAIAMFSLDWISGLVLFGSLIPLAALTRWFQLKSQMFFRDTRTASARLIVQFVETMTGIRAVKAFRKEKRNEEEFGGLVEEYRSTNYKVIQLFGIFDPGLVLIGNLALAVILLVGGLRVAGGGLEIGALLAALLYSRQFFAPAQEMAMFYNSYQSAAAALEKISGVLEEEPSVADPTRPIDLRKASGRVSFEGVEFAYKAGRVVLPTFDLEMPAGQTIALVGSTGAGKSTLAKLISRFYDPSQGTVSLDGVDLRKLHPKDLRRAIVMVTQEAYLFSGTVADNIALGKPDASREEVVRAAKAVGAHEFIESLPNGYDTDVNKRGGRVSAGQRQLLSFARAFIADPVVLILDEATASLDIPSERLVQEGLQTLLADRTAIIIAHRLSTVAIADRVLVMEHGRIVEDGTPRDLIAGTGRFAQLHAAWRDSARMTTITPYLWFDNNLDEALAYYSGIFPDARVLSSSRLDGTLMNAEFELAGQRFIGLNGGPLFSFSEAVSFLVSVETQDEVDHYWDTLTADGGEESRCGWLKDKFGISWQIVPTALPRYLTDPTTAGRVMPAMLQMRKIVIADLEAAAAG